MKNKNKEKLGFSIVEVLLAMGIFAIFSVGVFYLAVDTVQRDTKVNLNTESLLYAKEGLEAARNISDKNFLTLANGDHGLGLTEGSWSFIAAPEVINEFYERTITVYDVYRDEDGNISEDGDYFDPDTKKITSEVSWMQNGIIQEKTKLSTYISNWKGDDWIQTTCDEFNAGTFENTDTEETPAPPDNNCTVKLDEIEEASAFFSSADVGTHASDVDVDGNYAYISINSVSKGFGVVDISNPAAPVIKKTISVGNKGNYVTKSGNYVYMGIKSSGLGLAIVNVSTPTNPSLAIQWFIGSYGNQQAVSGNYLYTAVDMPYFAFLVYDISTKFLPIPLITDLVNFNHDVHAIELNGQYAYLGIDDDQKGFRVLNISNPYNVNQVAELDVGEEVNAVKILGPVAFVATEDSSDSLQVINISNPLSPSIVTSLDVGGEIQDLSISGDYLYAAIDETNAGLAAINISNPLSPDLAYSIDVQGKGTGIDSNENYIFVSTDTANKGLVIIGTTQAGVFEDGTYISSPLDTGSADPKYNYISWENSEVPGANVSFQIRTADTLDNLESATWVGSDGTNATHYENSRTQIVLSPDRSGSRYCQFKAFLESDGVSSPNIESVKINYTP